MTTNGLVPFAAPLVDHLAVRVVVNSRYENILPKETHPFVAIEHVGGNPGKLMSTLAAEWGLLLHLESMAGRARAQFLLDFGYTPEIINRNIDLLDIDPAKLKGLMLSHGHLDHYGGLDGFLLRHRPAMREDLSLYIGGEDAFAVRWVEDERVEKIRRRAGRGLLGALTRVSPLAHEADPAPYDCFRSLRPRHAAAA